MHWVQIVVMSASSILCSCWAMDKQISKEMKDVHARLCSLEERYCQMMQKILEKE